jgi:hypothetical protein
MMLYGTPCVRCGQPAMKMLITKERIVHIHESLKDCDAGDRTKGIKTVTISTPGRRGRGRPRSRV